VRGFNIQTQAHLRRALLNAPESFGLDRGMFAESRTIGDRQAAIDVQTFGARQRRRR